MPDRPSPASPSSKISKKNCDSHGKLTLAYGEKEVNNQNMTIFPLGSPAAKQMQDNGMTPASPWGQTFWTAFPQENTR